MRTTPGSRPPGRSSSGRWRPPTTARSISPTGATGSTTSRVTSGTSSSGCGRRPPVRADLDRTLSALADPTRRGVVELLRRKPHRASEIAQALATTRPAMSRHLRVLRKAGLVAPDGLEDDARARVYRL